MPGWHLAGLANKATRETFGVARADDGTPIVCTFTPKGGAAEVFKPIFDDGAKVIDYSGPEPVETTRPCADVVIADLSRAPRQDDRIAIGAQSYRILQTESTGHGTCKCWLGV